MHCATDLPTVSALDATDRTAACVPNSGPLHTFEWETDTYRWLLGQLGRI